VSSTASRIASADGQRSGFWKASARSTNWTIRGSTFGATVASERAGWVATRTTISVALSPSWT